MAASSPSARCSPPTANPGVVYRHRRISGPSDGEQLARIVDSSNAPHHPTGASMKTDRLPRLTLAMTLLFAATGVLAADRAASPAGAEVYIVSPKDGAKVKGPVTVVFGL